MQSFSVDHVGTTKWIAGTDGALACRPCACEPRVDHLASGSRAATPSAIRRVARARPVLHILVSAARGAVVNTHETGLHVGFALPPVWPPPGTHLLHTPDPVFDLYLFAGPTMPAAVMGQFTQLYGRPAMPRGCRWACGVSSEDSGRPLREGCASNTRARCRPPPS